jgi:hypothetical protein
MVLEVIFAQNWSMFEQINILKKHELWFLYTYVNLVHVQTISQLFLIYDMSRQNEPLRSPFRVFPTFEIIP